MIKDLIRSTLNVFGYEIRKRGERGFCASYLSQICAAKTVFDVGGADGTYELYQAYPKAKFFLIEPLREFEDALNRISSEYDCEVFRQAVGDEESKRRITVYPADPQLSTLKRRPSAAQEADSSESREIEVTTLDKILAENRDIQPPILLKIDTEGHELEALKDAKRLLTLTDTVILEASISKRFTDSYTFAELILFMRDNDFAVFDFLNISYGRGTPGANFTDIVFKRLDTHT
ncbi:MAG: FkbM family methyltransferase [Elusimicrobiota bacterium]